MLGADDSGLRVDTKAQAEQVRSVSVRRLGPVVGRVSTHLTARLDEAPRIHLQMQGPAQRS